MLLLESENWGGLKAYHKRFPNSKLFVITMDEEETIMYEGVVIEVLPVWKWLLECSGIKIRWRHQHVLDVLLLHQAHVIGLKLFEH